MATKLIKNNSSITQSVVYQGRQITLAPYVEERMDEILADVFIARCSPVVEEVIEEADLPFDTESDENIWIANVTGHPDYPATIKSKTLQNKKWVESTAPNPSAVAHPVHFEYDEGQKPYTGRDGSYLTLNMPKTDIVLPPFKRKAFRKDIGNWMLRQEGANVKYTEFSPAIIKSRKPSLYEPAMDWNLDEINAFLLCISSGAAKVGPSENELKAQMINEKWTKNQLKEKLDATKKAAIDSCWYYVVDPKHRLPTRSEVRELMTGKSNAEVVDEQVDRIMGANV